MKMFNSRSTILVGLGGAALMLAAIGCSSSSSPGDGGSGGTSAEGGKGGTSATGGSAGAAALALSYTFDSSVQGWAINTYHDTNSTNLGYELAPDAGIDASAPPTLTHDATDGNPATPTAGCLKLTATFTGYNQYVDVKVGISPTVNLSGKKMHAQVQLASATGGTFPGGAIIWRPTRAPRPTATAARPAPVSRRARGRRCSSTSIPSWPKAGRPTTTRWSSRSAFSSTRALLRPTGAPPSARSKRPS